MPPSTNPAVLAGVNGSQDIPPKPATPASSPQPKRAGYSAPDLLTSAEIEALRQDLQQASREMKQILQARMPHPRRPAN